MGQTGASRKDHGRAYLFGGSSGARHGLPGVCVTRDELGKVYEDIRPSLLRTLTGSYGLSRHDAEDLIQKITLGLLEHPELCVMSRP
jgi:hypothetical protein